MISVRKSNYRGQNGFLICGKGNNTGIFGVQIFVHFRDTADKIKEIYNKGLNKEGVNYLVKKDANEYREIKESKK